MKLLLKLSNIVRSKYWFVGKEDSISYWFANIHENYSYRQLRWLFCQCQLNQFEGTAAPSQRTEADLRARSALYRMHGFMNKCPPSESQGRAKWMDNSAITSHCYHPSTVLATVVFQLATKINRSTLGPMKLNVELANSSTSIQWQADDTARARDVAKRASGKQGTK